MSIIYPTFTVYVVYYRPDFRTLLQEFIFQTEDIPPQFPRVHKFLNFWKDNIDAVINNIEVCQSTGKDWKKIDFEYKA